jgi:hypothetical protein
MATESRIVFVCDRCGRRSEREADPHAAEEEPPTRWRTLELKGTIEQPYDRFDVCAACADSFAAFMRNIRVEPGDPEDAQLRDQLREIPF